MNSIVAFLIILVALLASIIYLDVNPSVGLFVATIAMGLMTRIPLPDILVGIGQGFGSTMTSIGLIILFGGIFGELLTASGATEEMAKGLLRKVDKKHDFLALNITGIIVSIPVFFGLAYIMLSSLLNFLQDITKKRMSAYCVALYSGLIITHCLVPPTPGPVAVASMLEANMGWFIFYSLIIAIPTALISGWRYSVRLNKQAIKNNKNFEGEKLSDEEFNEVIKANPGKPSSKIAVYLILLPIILIVVSSIVDLVVVEKNMLTQILMFLGNNNVAMFIAVIVSALVLNKYIDTGDKNIMSFIDPAADKLGSIILILGIGGSFGNIIQQSGVGDQLINLLQAWNIPVLLTAFLIAFLIRGAVGSAVVAMVTTTSIIGPVAISLGYSPIIVGLTICAATIGPALPADAAFWMPVKYNNISVKEDFKTVTVSTVLGSIIAFIAILIFNNFSHSLPGMF